MPRGLSLRLVLALLGLGGVAACGGPRPTDDLVPARAAIDGLSHRRCGYLDREPLPRTLDELTRPGTRGALLLRAGGASPTDSVELSIRYRHDGRLDWVRALRANVDPGQVAELERVLAAGVHDTGPADWGFRLRFVGGHLDAILPAVVCEPQRTGDIPRVMPPTGSPQEMAEARRARQTSISVNVTLDETGRVTDVRLPHPTGSRLLDAYALELARAMAYLPRLHDGAGVPTRTTVTFRFPRHWR
jgi:TonB family protein